MSEQIVDNLSKLFFVASGAWVMGRPVSVKLCGTEQEVKAMSEALAATRAFVEELNDRESTTESVVSKLQQKHEAAGRFEETLKLQWLL